MNNPDWLDHINYVHFLCEMKMFCYVAWEVLPSALHSPLCGMCGEGPTLHDVTRTRPLAPVRCICIVIFSYFFPNGKMFQEYAVKAQTSLASLSRFRFTRYYCACTPMLYISELCEDCAVANEIDYEIDDAWTSIHGIHDNGPRDHGVWRLTLTAYYVVCPASFLSLPHPTPTYACYAVVCRWLKEF